jgi:hypothetical protein
MRSITWLHAQAWYVAVLAVSAAFALAQTPMAAAQSKAPEELAEIRAAAERFLRALDDLDWEAFRASWASDPIVSSHLPIRRDRAGSCRGALAAVFEKCGRVGPDRLTCT